MENNKAVIIFTIIMAFALGLAVQYKIQQVTHTHEPQQQDGHVHATDTSGGGHVHATDASGHGHVHEADAAQQAHGHAHGHGHDHGDGKTSQMTVYDDQIEIFLEHPYLVAGQGAEFVTHVSYMQSGLPRKAGPVTFIMQQGQQKPVEHIDKGPARDGIYIPTLTFPRAGQWKLAMSIPTENGPHRIDLQDVTVYASQQQADDAPEQDGPEGISFLKEEQWVWRTLTEFVQPQEIDGSRSLVVPTTCIVYDRDTAIAYVQLSGETVEKRNITLGKTKDGMVQVLSGLKSGERVISRSAYVIAQKEHAGDSQATAHAPHGETPAGVVHLTDQVIDKHGIESNLASSAMLDRQLTLNGQIALNADKVAHIVPITSGIVREVYRDEGDKVRKGEVLAWIESSELADAKSTYLSASEQFDMTRQIFEREEKLWEQKISSAQEYLEKKQAFTEARIAKRTAEQKLYAIGFDKASLERLSAEPEQYLTKYELVAPYDGTILSKHLTLGESVSTDHDAFILADMENVWVEFQVHGMDASLVKAGQKVIVKSQSGQDPFECILSYVSPVVEQETRTSLARAVLSNDSGKYRPGQYIRGTVLMENIPAKVAIDKDAIQYIDDEPCVFIKTSEGFEKRLVQLGHATKDQVEITAGLTTQDEVVVQNAFLIKSELEKTADAYGGHGHPH